MLKSELIAKLNEIEGDIDIIFESYNFELHSIIKLRKITYNDLNSTFVILSSL